MSLDARLVRRFPGYLDVQYRFAGGKHPLE